MFIVSLCTNKTKMKEGNKTNNNKKNQIYDEPICRYKF